MAKRKIIEIERDLCDGCGLCTTACAEGALALDDENKAVLVKEIYCDGMGACLDVCPTGALKIVEREGAGYDASAAYEHVLETRGAEAASQVHGAKEARAGEGPGGGKAAGRRPAGGGRGAGVPGTGAVTEARVKSGSKRIPLACGCPGSAAQEIKREKAAEPQSQRAVSGASELRQWPIQLHLVSPYAPYFKEADLLIAADCTAFSLGSFHQDLLKGKMLVIACPKLDETEGYIEKLTEIIRENRPKSLAVAIMTVPCCSGLRMMVEEAVRRSGMALPVETKVIHIDGRIVA